MTTIERAITANRGMLHVPAESYDRNLYDYAKLGKYPSNKAPFVEPEYSVVFTDIHDGFNGEYSGEHEEMHVIMLDEDNIPVVGSIVSKDDDLIQAVRNVAFLAKIMPCSDGLTDSQLRAGLEVAQDFEPVDDEMQLLAYAMRWLYNMSPVHRLFAEPQATRKNRTDYVQQYKGNREKVKKVALQIWNG